MDNLYSLRKNFTIIGVTGKTGAGCSQIAQALSNPNFAQSLKSLLVEETSNTDQLKLNVCINYLLNDKNWTEYKIINYKDVLFLHLIYEGILDTKNKNEAIENIVEIITQNGKSRNSIFKNRFDIGDTCIESIRKFFNTAEDKWFEYPDKNLTCSTLKECLADKKECDDFYSF